MEEVLTDITVYTPEETAAILKIDIQTLWKWTREGRIHSINLSGNRLKRYRHKEIADFLDRMENKGGQENEQEH